MFGENSVGDHSENHFGAYLLNRVEGYVNSCVKRAMKGIYCKQYMN